MSLGQAPLGSSRSIVGPLVAGGVPPRARAAGSEPGRLVLVAVGAIDRRALAAVRYARSVPAEEHRAVHVAIDPAQAEQVGLRWMQSEHDRLPLDIVEDAGGVSTTVAAVAENALAEGATEVVVVIGRLSMPGLRRWLLHDGTADTISRAVSRVPAAHCVELSVPLRP